MRPHLFAHASPGRPVRALARAWAVLTLAALTPARALASHYVVDASGRGDFTTVQAAVGAASVSPRDSLLIEPGAYPETVVFTIGVPPLSVVGLGGATRTTLHSIVVPNTESGPAPSWRLEGVTFDRLVDLPGSAGFLFATRCRFLAGVHAMDRWHGVPNFANCEFDAPTRLAGYGGAGSGFVGLRFTGAPLDLSTSGGRLPLEQCTFEGPADTLVFAHPGSELDGVGFTRCWFSGAAYAVVADRSCDTDVGFDACRFSDIARDAVRQVDDSAYDVWCEPTRLVVSDSRFTRCGTAIRWTPGASTWVGLARDSVFDSTGDGVVVSPGGFSVAPMISQVIVERSGGHGFVIDRRPYRGGGGFEDALSLTRCQFRDNRGDGLRVADTLAFVFGSPTLVTCSISERNAGAGFRLEGMNWSVRLNVARANGGDGLVFRSLLPTSYFSGDSITYNTCAANAGDGMRLEHAAAPGDYVQIVRNDLAALNLGRGIATTSPRLGTVAFNDAWSNSAGDFANVSAPADSNLSADPQFCNLAAGDLRLRFGSPCGGGGAYRAIGAEPEACASPGGQPGASFAAHPIPARGALEFTVPAGGPDGRIVVLDAQGRRVWARAVRAGERVQWTGEGAGGRVPPGLYFARLERPGESRLVRVVWLK